MAEQQRRARTAAKGKRQSDDIACCLCFDLFIFLAFELLRSCLRKPGYLWIGVMPVPIIALDIL